MKSSEETSSKHKPSTSFNLTRCSADFTEKSSNDWKPQQVSFTHNKVSVLIKTAEQIKG